MKKTNKENVEIPKVSTPIVEPNFVPIQMSSNTKLFDKAMKQVKASGQKMVEKSHAEAVKYRLALGMDESGHSIKIIETDPETGLVIKKKRGRKPKVKVENLKPSAKGLVVLGVKPIKAEKPVRLDKPVKAVKPVKKKEKNGAKGRVASAPILNFDVKDASLDTKAGIFDNAMTACFGNKYDKKKLLIDGLSIVVTKTLTRPTAKNPNGVLLVELSTKDKVAKFYEWSNKFWMAQLVNYSHYMKPIKK